MISISEADAMTIVRSAKVLKILAPRGNKESNALRMLQLVGKRIERKLYNDKQR